MPIKVALIHDWLVTYRGGEKVLEAIAELYPGAEIFTLFYTKGAPGPGLEGRRIHASGLNKLPGVKRYYRRLLPILPMAIETFDLSDFDIIISSSHCVAKGIIPPPDALHICYCHTPMRYVWDKASDYFPKGWKGALFQPFLHALRTWDAASSARVDHFIANSEWVAKRIQKYYRREASVIYPFTDYKIVPPTPGDSGDYYLVVSGFAPYKRIDLAIQACEQLRRKLIVVGEGQDEKRLKRLAGPFTTFLGRLGGEYLSDLYAGARALLFPGEEDFGIVPLEAMAHGRPVIAFNKGGATETVIDGETGIFFDEQTVESLAEAIRQYELHHAHFEPAKCQARALQFNKRRFQEEFKQTVAGYLRESRRSLLLESRFSNPLEQ